LLCKLASFLIFLGEGIYICQRVCDLMQGYVSWWSFLLVTSTFSQRGFAPMQFTFEACITNTSCYTCTNHQVAAMKMNITLHRRIKVELNIMWHLRSMTNNEKIIGNIC
jgi:hypothetical protein